MNEGCNEAYTQAGVDVTAGYESNKLIKPLIEQTKTAGVLNHLNDFGGFFKLSKNFDQPVLVSSTDGVGTKIKIASVLNKHDSIGIDCVAMCVNDIVCSGATPLFFLDYIACGKNIPEKIKKIVEGVANGCKQSNIALIGGETAEHPNIMADDEYDLAGFCVGIVEQSKILPKPNQKAGDVLIALPSNGVHSNGFSLIRKIFDPQTTNFENDFEGSLQKNLGQTLLEPTKIYVKPIMNLIKEIEVKGICHITGGGFFENIPRILNKNLDAIVEKNRIKTPKIFEIIANQGNISQQNMFSTFNMGVGMICITSKQNSQNAIQILQNSNIDAYEIGWLEHGSKKIIIK